jgi:hypothetical protein
VKTSQNPNQQQSSIQEPPKEAAKKTESPAEFGVADKIRPELTIEKWPAIWRPAKSQNAPEVRTFERSVTLRDGTSGTAKVEVGFTHLGNLTTEDQKTYYALIKQWESKGRSSEFTYFSTRKLARLLKKQWGTNVIESTTESLRRLRTTPFAWTNSYRDSATREEIEVLDTFTILSDLKIIRRKSDGHITREAGYFRFHDMMLKNLIANHTKPLRFDVILGFKSEIAQLLYSHVDLVLARNDHYERRSKELFDDLGLRGTSYRNASDRRRKLNRALVELRGAPLSTGILRSAGIERTKDRKDYKVVFRKTSHEPLFSTDTTEKPMAVMTSQSKTPAEEGPLMTQAVELVSHFHRLFLRAENSYPRPREIVQAVSLIASHGFDQAKRIVTFSYRAAQETNYRPQTFGGILQYKSRALAYFELQAYEKRTAENAKINQETRDSAHTEATRSVDDRLGSLTDMEYKRAYHRVRDEMIDEHPRLAGDKSGLFNSAIRARMAREMAALQNDIFKSVTAQDQKQVSDSAGGADQ